MAAGRPPEPASSPGPASPADPAPDLERQAWLERRRILREAAIAAEMATGLQERTEQAAKRNVMFRLATIAVGFVVLTGGLVMMVLPGPGVLGVLAGLGILSRELPWAERLMEYIKKRAKIDELKEQPRWIQVTMWIVTVLAVCASVGYFAFIR